MCLLSVLLLLLLWRELPSSHSALSRIHIVWAHAVWEALVTTLHLASRVPELLSQVLLNRRMSALMRSVDLSLWSDAIVVHHRVRARVIPSLCWN